jgi:hypothetical protein
MHELVKAVLALALSAAAAVWLLGVALHLWPSADQLAYGNPLPYLKVRMDSGAARWRTSAVSPTSGSGSTSMASSRPLASLAQTPRRSAATR